MIALIIATICAALFSIIFKIFQLKGVDVRQAIIFNYLTAFILGCLMSFNFESGIQVNPLKSDWLVYAILIGIVFYLGMVVLSGSTLRAGVTITTVCSRASMIIPILICFMFIPGSATPKWIPMLVALLSLFLIIYDGKVNRQNSNGIGRYLMPFLVFITFGTTNSCMKIMQYNISKVNADVPEYIVNQELSMLSATIFISAMFTGIIYGTFGWKKKRSAFQIKNLFGGIGLGACNFFCTYMLMISMKSIDSSFLFPFHNIGVVLIGALIGWSVFHEKLRPHQLIGILLAIITIWWISV
jgi:drug/metabolite transporter (DMT)-like permease